MTFPENLKETLEKLDSLRESSQDEGQYTFTYFKIYRFHLVKQMVLLLSHWTLTNKFSNIATGKNDRMSDKYAKVITLANLKRDTERSESIKTRS